MKFMFVLIALALVAVVVAAPVDDKETSVLRYDSDNIGVGPYNWE